MEGEMEVVNEIVLPQLEYKGGAEAVLQFEPNSSVSVAYHPLFGPHEELLLLELDEKLLPDVLHQRVTLRGDADEDAVLCTQSKTYAIKYVGTSNSVFLIPPLDQPDFLKNLQSSGEKNDNQQSIVSVLKVASGSMEIVEVAPRLEKLKSLLLENPYKTDEVLDMEIDGIEENKRSLYKWEDLIEKIQASDDELISGLHALFAVEINGYFRIVHEDYMDSILKILLNNSVIHDWSLNALDEDEVVDVLETDGFPRELALHCLQVYGNRGDKVTDTKCLWSLDEKRVCVHFARRILRGRKMKMDDFMDEWLRKVPEGMQANFSMLQGEVLTESFGVESLVYPFSVSSLPSTPPERFASVFKERSKWEWKDLEHYIRDLSVPGLSAEGLLLKYTRRTQATPEAEPVFCAR